VLVLDIAGLCFGASILQQTQVLTRIQQTIDMVNTEPCYQSLLEQSEREPMDCVENFRLLDPNSCQLVNVEEAAIINLVGGDVPEAQAISLLLQEPL
jgi:hypothetical protein